MKGPFDVQSSLDSSDNGYLGIRVIPSISRIGPPKRSYLPDIGPRYPIPRIVLYLGMKCLAQVYSRPWIARMPDTSD